MKELIGLDDGLTKMVFRLEAGRELLNYLYLADKNESKMREVSVNLCSVNLYHKTHKVQLNDETEYKRLVSSEVSERKEVRPEVLFAHAILHTLFDMSNFKTIERWAKDFQNSDRISNLREQSKCRFWATLLPEEQKVLAPIRESDRMFFLQLLRERCTRR